MKAVVFDGIGSVKLEDAPSQALKWSIECVAKAGTVSVIGVYSAPVMNFPIEQVMNKNLTLKAGNCNHRRYMPEMIELVRSGVIGPEQFLTHIEPMTSAIEAHQAFDQHRRGWIKVKLEPAQTAQRAAWRWHFRQARLAETKTC